VNDVAAASPPDPYDALDQTPAGPSTEDREPSAARAILRGLARRCPRCGSGGLFRGWLRIRERCPRCGLRLEREEGGFLGAMTINYLVTVLVWVVLLVAWLVVDLPHVHVAALTVASIALVGIFPIIYFPFAKTTWTAIDYLVYRSSPDYATRDASERASGNGGPY
jgi:uncharacterized protein (DUF983 family)